jgi:hypothetical protein
MLTSHPDSCSFHVDGGYGSFLGVLSPALNSQSLGLQASLAQYHFHPRSHPHFSGLLSKLHFRRAVPANN